jgi:hypothetical protein
MVIPLWLGRSCPCWLWLYPSHPHDVLLSDLCLSPPLDVASNVKRFIRNTELVLADLLTAHTGPYKVPYEWE